MAINNLEAAFLMELRDMYGAEKKIAKALPKMAKKADSEDLREAFESHLAETEQQIARLEEVFEHLGQKPRTKKCEAIEGILEEGKEIMSEDAEPATMDAMMIAAAQKVEHYEIASYGTLCTWAEQLGFDKAAIDLLKENLSEEKEADSKLTSIAESINVEAAEPAEA